MLLSDPQINCIVKNERKKTHHLRAAFPHGQPKGGAPNPREGVCL